MKMVLNLCGMLAMSVILQLASATNMKGQPTYVHCNVFSEIACFGIGLGDRLSMEIPADFVVYRVTLASGGQGTIYLGHSPSIDSEALSIKQSQCVANNIECQGSEYSSWGVESFYTSPSGLTLHLTMNFKEPEERVGAEEFLKNFRACERKGDVLRCAEASIFGM